MTAFLNGEFLPVEAARVPALDRGFLFGDGVYELIPAYGGRLFRLDEHLARLARSLAEVRIDNPYPPARWREILIELTRRGGTGDVSIYLQVTRGPGPRDHVFPRQAKPTVFAMVSPLTPFAPEWPATGAAAITVEDIRWQRCDIKAINLLPNVLLRQQAFEAGAVEALLIRDGLVTEGAASNLFIVRENEILTPPKGPQLLPGITRDLLLELAATNDLPHREAAIPQAWLSDAQEIWISSSAKEVLAITRLDEIPVADGRPGPVWKRMYGLVQDYKAALRAGSKLSD